MNYSQKRHPLAYAVSQALYGNPLAGHYFFPVPLL